MVDIGATASGKSNRFVCPNDRQLALRAKLKTGWSVKTGSLEGFSSTPTLNHPLGEEEQRTIVNVIQRAEKLDLTEQERVGKLVERLETMRRNALGRGPNQCLLCGDNFGILGPQKVRCIDCGRWACLRCAIDKFSSRNSCASKDHYLCMICAETREIWKKSGAWFFKSLPKYILPNDSRFIRNRSMRMTRRYREDGSSSEDERKGQPRNRVRRNSGTESMHDAPDQESFSYATTNNVSRQTSSSDLQLSKELEPLRNYMGSMSLSTDPRSWEESTSDFRGDGESAEASRRESMASRSMSDWNWSDTKSIEEKLSPSTCSIKSSGESGDQKQPVDTSMGIIELSLNYDQVTNILHCTVYRAKNVIPMDIGGLSDPFCKLNILPNAKVSTRLRTKTVHKTRNPEFNENLTFYDITEDDLAQKSLHVLVVDDDKYGHDYMGEVRIKLDKLRVQNTIYLTVPLGNFRLEQKGPLPAPELNQWFDFDLWSRGQILLSLCYSTKKRALLVTVKRCANLLPMDNNGFSDPFIKLQLKPDPHHRKHKTSVKWKNLNPVYNEEFAFETRPTELYMQSLYITVFDKDYGKRNDYLGGLILGGSGSKGVSEFLVFSSSQSNTMSIPEPTVLQNTCMMSQPGPLKPLSLSNRPTSKAKALLLNNRDDVNQQWIKDQQLPLSLSNRSTPKVLPISSNSEDVNLHWTKDHSLILIDCYKMFRGKVGGMEIRNLKKMWEVIANYILKTYNIKYMATNCENRWRVLERNYKKYVENNSQTGRGTKYFEFAEEMDAIFKKKRNIFPEILLSSSSTTVNSPQLNIDESLEVSTNETENFDSSLEGNTSMVTPKKPPNISVEKTPKIASNIRKRIQSTKYKRDSIIVQMRMDRKQYQEERLKQEKNKIEQMFEIEREKLEIKKRRNELLEARNKLLEQLSLNTQLSDNLVSIL